MLRWTGGLICLLALLVPALWLELAGTAGRDTLGVMLAFVPVLLVGGGVWMWGMARSEAEEAGRWARVDAAVAEARRHLAARGAPGLDEPAPVIERRPPKRREAVARRRGPAPLPQRGKATATRRRSARRRPATVPVESATPSESAIPSVPAAPAPVTAAARRAASPSPGV